MNIANLTIREARAGLDKGAFSSEDLVRACQDNIKARNVELNVYLRTFDDCIDEAKSVDAKRARGEKLGALAGIPVAIKDVIMVKGREVTGASKILKGHFATYDATAVAKLRDAGAIFMGMVNADEFAMGSSGEHSAYGPTRHPLDTTRVPGGSSSGSAVSVASGMATASLGTETGGSVRLPAAFCGLVGLKPTYGAVSRYGLLPMATSVNQIGPITRTVTDAEIMFNIISGYDKKDANSLNPDFVTSKDLGKEKNYEPGVIGVTDFAPEGLDPRVKANFDASVSKLESLGYKIKQVSLPSLPYCVPCYYILVPAEISADLARLDGLRYGAHVDGANLLEDYMKTRGQGFGKEVRRRIILGTYVLSAGYYDAYYYKAMRVRELMKQDFARVFNEVDAIAMPVSAGPAFKIGAKSTRSPIEMYLEDVFTAPANIVGVPAISVPSGTVSEGGFDLPLGLQIIAPNLGEDRLFSIGKKFLGEN